MKAADYPNARFCCMECDELLPQGAETCPHCGAVVAEMNFSLRSNWRAAKLAAKEAWDAGAPERQRAKENYERVSREQAEAKRMREDGMRPVAAVIVDTTSKKSGVGRAVVGGVIAGPVGAVVGAVTGTSKTKSVTFSVKYKNGTSKLETVGVNSARYKELAKLLVQ